MVTASDCSGYPIGGGVIARTPILDLRTDLPITQHGGLPQIALNLPLPSQQLQAAAAQNRSRAASTSAVRHLSTSSWSGSSVGSHDRNGATGWQPAGSPLPLPSPGIPIQGAETAGEGNIAHSHSRGSERSTRTHAFFGTSHTSDTPLPPRPLPGPRDSSPGSGPVMEPLTANPTGPSEFRANGRNRQRSRESFREGETSWTTASEARLPSEVAMERMDSVQSLNRARSLNDRPPTRSNTFFAQTYHVTPPISSPASRQVATQPLAHSQPGYVSLGIGPSPAKRAASQHISPRAATMPTGSVLPPKPPALHYDLPISPVESVSSMPASHSSASLSPPSKLTRESSNTGRSPHGSFTHGQVLRAVGSDESGVGVEARRYRLESPLGEGAFSVVWSAIEVDDELEDGRKPRRVAIKLMAKRLCEKNDRTRISFLREVAVLKHISHPHIVEYITSFSTSDYHCLVLEHLSGGELFNLMQRPGNRRRMSEAFLSRVFAELCRAVGWLHQAAVVHRDLKLENILLIVDPFSSDYEAPDGSIVVERLPQPLIKLSDFGLSRFIDPENPLLRTRCGSESFAAPEIIMGQPYDGRDTDSWAVGVILFAMLAGELPFDETSPNGTMLEGEGDRRKRMMRIARGSYEWPSNASIPNAAKEVVSKLIERDPRRRVRIGDALWDLAWLRDSGVPRPGRTSMEEIAESTVDGITRVLDGFLIHQGQQVEEIAHAEMEK